MYLVHRIKTYYTIIINFIIIFFFLLLIGKIKCNEDTNFDLSLALLILFVRNENGIACTE